MVTNSMQLLIERQTQHGTELIPFVDVFIVGFDRESHTLTLDPPSGPQMTTAHRHHHIVPRSPAGIDLVGYWPRGSHLMMDWRSVTSSIFVTTVKASIGGADDTPFGGGPGMLIGAEPTLKAIRDVREQNDGPVVILSPEAWFNQTSQTSSGKSGGPFYAGATRASTSV